MRLERAKEEFAVRYYRWALEDARREVSEGFRLVRSIKDALAMRTVAYLERLSLIEQIELLSALIKRFHPRAVELTSERMSLREEGLMKAKDDAILSLHLPIEAELGPFSPNKRPRMSRSRFATLLKKEMVDLFGEPPPADKKAGFFRTPIGDWTFSTSVSYGSPPLYLQSIRATERWYLQEYVSVLSWLGIAGQTSWDLARAGDEAETVHSIRNCCAHFLEAARGLLSGLSFDSQDKSHASSS